MAVESGSRETTPRRGSGALRLRLRLGSLLATLVSLATLLTGVAAVSSASPVAAASCSSSGVPGDQTITVDGASVPLYLPAGYSGGRIPLVLDLHGSSSSGLQQIAGDGIRAIADREQFAVVAPNGAVPFSPAPGFVGFAWNIPGVPL